jgi:hypothetical protein
MSNEATKEAEETEAKPTITVAEKNSGNTNTSNSKETITVAEKSDKSE